MGCLFNVLLWVLSYCSFYFITLLNKVSAALAMRWQYCHLLCHILGWTFVDVWRVGDILIRAWNVAYLNTDVTDKCDTKFYWTPWTMAYSFVEGFKIIFLQTINGCCGCVTQTCTEVLKLTKYGTSYLHSTWK